MGCETHLWDLFGGCTQFFGLVFLFAVLYVLGIVLGCSAIANEMDRWRK